jgi:hypothetical protein
MEIIPHDSHNAQIVPSLTGGCIDVNLITAWHTLTERHYNIGKPYLRT